MVWCRNQLLCASIPGHPHSSYFLTATDFPIVMWWHFWLLQSQCGYFPTRLLIHPLVWCDLGQSGFLASPFFPGLSWLPLWLSRNHLRLLLRLLQCNLELKWWTTAAWRHHPHHHLSFDNDADSFWRFLWHSRNFINASSNLCLVLELLAQIFGVSFLGSQSCSPSLFAPFRHPDWELCSQAIGAWN